MLKKKASAYLSLLILLVLASLTNAQCPTPSIAASSNSICLGNSTTLTVLSGAGASNALNFDGVNDYMATNFDCDVNVVPVTTWEAWVYPTTQNGSWQMIMSVEDGGWDRFIAINNLNVYMGYGCNGWNPTSLTLNQWQHIAVVYNEPANQIIFYKNGVAYPFTIPGGCSHSSAVKYTLGCSTPGAPSQFFAGSLDEVRVWNVARTQAQIVANMSVTIPSNSSGLLLNYQFNEGTGVNTANLVGASYTGTLTNGPTWQVPSTAPITSSGLANGTFTWSNGANTSSIVVSPSVTTSYSVINTNTASCTANSAPITITVTQLTAQITGANTVCAGNSSTLTITNGAGASNALNFDGADDYVAIPSASQLMLLSGWTLETWVKRASSGAQHSIIEKYDWAGGAGGYLLRILSSGQVRASNIQGASANDVTGTSVLATGTWYHLAATFNPGTSSLKVYVNGVLEGTNNAAGLTPANSTLPLKIGSRGNDNGTPLNGSMDEVRIWNTERTQAQIVANMSTTIPGNSSGLVAYYQFNESSGLTTADITGNSNAGALTNGPSWQVPSTAPVSSTGLANGTFTWSNGANTSSITINPTVTTSYSVAFTTTTGCIGTSTLATVNVNPLPVVSISGSSAICVGQTATLVANGANTYTWSNASTASSITLSPASNTSYSLTGTAAGCIGSATTNLIVNANPIITVNSGAICAGQNFTINPNGANTYTIQGGNAVVSPAANTSYTVAGTSTAGCVSQAFATSNLIVNANPIITVNNGVICAGQNFTINPNGANTYTIQGGSAVVSPAGNTSYTVAGTSTAGCLSQAFATSNLTVNPNPTITVNNGTICVGQNFTINPNGANTYTIQGGNAVVSPPSNSSYTVIGTNSVTGCRSQAFATSSLTVNANPIITVNSGAICAGQNFTINPNGANTYTIQGGNAVVSPAGNTSYTVAGTSTAGCVSQAFATSNLTVNPNPIITVNNGAICAGQNFTINPNGANTYTIQGGSAVVSPTSNASFTVAGTSTAGCLSQAFATSNLTVNPNPTITVNNGTICVGQNFTINPNGANTYTIQGGNAVVSPPSNSSYTVIGTNSVTGCRSQAFATSSLIVNQNPIITVNNGTICAGQNFTINPNGANTYTIQGGNAVVSPPSNAVFTVAGTSTAGCVSQAFATSSLIVNQNPTITVNNGAICAGQSFTINPNGANTYTIQGGSALVSPAGNTSFTVAGTSTAGCVSQAFATSNLTVNPNPTVSISGASGICTGQNASLTANGATTYTWSTGSNSASIITTPTANTTYTLTGSTPQGCSSFTTQLVTVQLSLSVSIAGPTTICYGQAANLSGLGGVTYTWNTGATTATVAPTLTTTTTFSLIGASGTCSNTASKTISVTPNPTVTITGTNAICAGGSSSLTVNGATTYTWSSGSTSASVVFSPSATSVYSVVGSYSTGCLNATTQTVTVYALPVVSISGASVVCLGDSIALVANGANTYVWNNNATTTTIVITPTTTSTYSAVGTNTNGCVGLSASKSVTVNPVPILSIISTATAICAGDTVKFTAAGATSYAWNIGDNDSLIVVTPTITTTYSVVGTNGFGCTSTKTDSVKVNALPNITISGTTGTICIGENITLTANGANTYTWSGGINTNSIAVSPSVSTTYSASGTSTDGCVGSNTLQLNVTECTNIKTIASKANIKVYPNPNNGEFTIELTNINNSNITITNVLGQIIKTQKAELMNQIDLNAFDKGIYFINVMENNQSVYRGSIIKE